MKSGKLVVIMGMAMTVSLAVSLGKWVSSSSQAACCYFAAKDKDINQPGQKAFISWNPGSHTEAFTVQPKFEGNAVDFGMVIPTPARPKLDEMPRDFFKDLAIYTILMPLPQPIYTPGDYPPPMSASASMASPMGMLMKDERSKSVRVLESGTVGSLDYKIIVASDAGGLFQWLKDNKYSYGGDENTLQFYIKKKSFFTVMKIDPKQMRKATDGSYLGEVTPTRFTFSSNECMYPLKITQLSVKDKTDALFYVQSPVQMDLPGDWSWMHSYRVMYLTYMLGCSANPQEQKELQSRNDWLQKKVTQERTFETTKLEWAKKLNAGDMSVLEDPLKNYSQMGTGDLPPGAKKMTVDDFIKEIRPKFKDQNKASVEKQLANMEDQYQPAKGVIVKYDDKTVGKGGYIWSHYAFYPAREVPQDDVKGLTRLKGHLQNGQWLTKFRKIVRKDEMTKDLVLAVVPKEQEQTYLRIMPTSPP